MIYTFFFPEFNPKDAKRHQKKSQSFATKIKAQKKDRNVKMRLTNKYLFFLGQSKKTLKFVTKSLWNGVTSAPDLSHNTAAWIGCVWHLWPPYNVPQKNKCNNKDGQLICGKKNLPSRKIARRPQKHFFCIFKNVRFIICDFKRKLCCWFFNF